jgi:Uma2 family endonuclease
VVISLDQRLGAGCEALAGDLRGETGGRIRYPDAVVLCGEDDPAEGSFSPVLVIEVLSPSTALVDRRVKPAEYAAVASIRAYVLLEQDQPRATVLRRSAEETVEGLEGVIRLPELAVDLPLLAL